MEVNKFVVDNAEFNLREKPISEKTLEISPGKFPYITDKLKFEANVTFFWTDLKEHEAHFRLIDERNEELIPISPNPFEVEIPVHKTSKMIPMIIEWTNVPFPHAGNYKAILMLDDEEKEFFTISIKELLEIKE